VSASAGDYGLIGDTRTAALVSPDGSIDWLCLPRFDSDPVFGRLVDPQSGGSFRITTDGSTVSSRRYLPATGVLETTRRSEDGEAVIRDGMVLDVSSSLLPQALLVRRVTCERGTLKVRIIFDPRRGIPGSRPPTVRQTARGVLCSWGSLAVGCSNDADLAVEPGREAVLDLVAGRSVTFCVGLADRQPFVWVDPRRASDLIDETTGWWRSWCDSIRYDGVHREAVERSMITLRMLTYSPSGAPVAAPTTSLPAPPGSERAWDYRFAWPRDAGIGVEAFLALQGPQTARAFARWLLHATQTSRPRLDPLYTLFGRSSGAEHSVRVAGRAEPVRLGNEAGRQRQLDVYGWVLNGTARLAVHEQALDRESWRATRQLAGYVADHWRDPDHGMWEVRCDPQHHVHSKIMAWVALDRAITLAASQRARPRSMARWNDARSALADEIRSRGVDHDRGVYVGRYGSKALDAALLLVPTVGFDDPRSEIVARTIAAVRSELGAGDPLLYRYLPGYDGLPGSEGAFLPCSFWLAAALARSGSLDEAADVFDRLVGLANPLGLYAEQMDPSTRQHIGNFPQALTHAALLQAAVAIGDATAARETSRESLRTPRARRARRPVSPGRS
jgi:GH15 family glucan-1,4-alpha-glucosidase